MRSPACKHSRPFFLISSLLLKFCLPEEVVVVDRVGSTQIEQNQMVLVRCVMAGDNCNSAEKRILKEFHEFESNPSDDFKCALLDWNIYEWQFALRGPSGTEFEGGIYHGRIKFPEEYPSKPPSFMFLTENGCFKTQRDICLSRFLKWQSSWTVRYALLALIDLMPTYPDDELCSSEFIKEGRRALALKSRAAATTYGSSERQKVIDQIHEYMLSKAPNGTGGGSEPSQASNGTGGVSVAYNISGVTLVLNVIGDTFNGTNSDRVGILGSLNVAFIWGGGAERADWDRAPHS
ncbi:hypothetical protein ACE6H2_024880 [Prunus campanulata]